MGIWTAMGNLRILNELKWPLGNYGTRGGFGFIPTVFLPYPTTHLAEGGISHRSDLFLRPFPLPIQGPNPPCAPRTTSPPVNSLELQCKYILRWKYMRRLLRNTLNPQMPSDNIRIHWGCKYFYLPIQFTSLHGLEVQHLSPIYNHCTPQIFKSSFLIVFMILRFPHIYL